MEKLKMKLIAEDFEEEPFYEEIEAPRFVDLTRSDPLLPDDRYWFCSRVGCDLKHEEELDLEAISKNFVLRAMAARSPNLKFQKALSKRQTENKKCPLSAPPKPSKPRIPKLALLSSVSRKLIVDSKDTIQPPLNPNSTPKARVKHVAAKYMTTPRVKKPVAESKPFNSVRNLPITTSGISKTQLVAKALSFTSPKKVVKAKAVENPSTTPIKKLCSAMKKLEITKQKKGTTTGESRSKKLLGYTKPQEENEKSSRSGNSKKVLGVSQTQEENKKSSRSVNSKIKGVAQKKSNTKPREEDEKSSRSVKSKIKGVAQKKSNTKPREEDEKSSRSGNSKQVLGETKTQEENKKSSRSVNSKTKGVAHKRSNTKSVLCEVGTGDMSNQRMDVNKTEISCSSGPCSESSKPENGEVSSETTKFGSNSSQQSTEERIVDPQNLGVEAQSTNDNHSNEENGNDQNPSTVEKENAQSTGDSHSNEESGNEQNPSNDEKENASFCDINRASTVNRGQSGGDHGGVQQEPSKKTKVLKENRSGCTEVQGVKYKKQKTTNPKPFRLRTDERSILKEATLERKQQEEENQINVNIMVQSEGGLRKDMNNKSSKNQEALMRTKLPNRSASTKHKLASCKFQQKDANNNKVSTSTRLTTTSLRKREQRTLQRQGGLPNNKACSSLVKSTR